MLKAATTEVALQLDEIEDLSFELEGTKADFLLKPFAPSGLLQKIRAAIEAPPE